MSLREELAQVPPERPGSACVTCVFITTFPPDERAEWRQLLARDSGEGTDRLWRFAKHKGFAYVMSAFRRHRTHHEATSVPA